MKRKLVMIGNGMAGVSFLEQLLKLNPNRYDITVIGAEPHPNYNRIMLSSVLAGDASMKDIILNDWDWYRDNNIMLHAGQTVESIDTKKQTVKTDKGIVVSYDELIFATGSLPFMLPLPGADKEGVIAFRDIQDCESMIETAKKYKKAVVIGGGLLGLEAARGLLNLNMEVFVVHINEYLMNLSARHNGIRLLQQELENQGMKFLLKKNSETILGKKRVTGLRFTGRYQKLKPILSLWLSGLSLISRLPKTAVSKSIEVSSSMIFLKRVCRIFIPLANAQSIEALPTAWSLRYMSKALFLPKDWLALNRWLSRFSCIHETESFGRGCVLRRRICTINRVRVQFVCKMISKVFIRKLSFENGKVIGAVLFGDISDGSQTVCDDPQRRGCNRERKDRSPSAKVEAKRSLALI